MMVQRDGVLRTMGEQIHPEHTALVVVDVQNDFIHPEGWYGKDVYADIPQVGSKQDSEIGALRMLANLKPLLAAARRSGVFVAFVQAIYDPQYMSPSQTFILERQGTYGLICLDGTFGARIHEDVTPQPGAREVVVRKHRFSAFWGTDMDLILRSNDIKTVVMTGTVTSGCVEATARDAAFNDYYVVTVEDCCADWLDGRQKTAIETMGFACGFVASAQEVQDIWAEQG